MSDDVKNIDSDKVHKILVVDLEPTHYKTDLWNVISDSVLTEVDVIYTQVKNWSPDGGHNYLKFPDKKYPSTVYEGRGFFGMLKSAFAVSNKIRRHDTDIVIIYGYAHIQMVFSLLAAFIFKKRFLLYVDEFNNKLPPGKLAYFKWVVRETLRLFSFKFAEAVLVCGFKGIDSAVNAGCARNKVYDFPYAVDLKRIISDTPDNIPEQCLIDQENSTQILFFSGRMIERKGLISLLSALASFQGANPDKNWVLWIEGDGPEIKRYINVAKEYGVTDRCRFLGFCQYDLHSWLIRSSDIVIVPSLEDNWGIVVDEGLQLGKIVVTSDATGSGCDRITDKSNGYIFPAGNANALANLLGLLMNGKVDKVSIQNAARSGKCNITPTDNLNTLLNIVRRQFNE